MLYLEIKTTKVAGIVSENPEPVHSFHFGGHEFGLLKVWFVLWLTNPLLWTRKSGFASLILKDFDSVWDLNFQRFGLFSQIQPIWMWHGIVVSTTGYCAGGWGSNLAWPGLKNGKLHLSSFWPQIIVVFMCSVSKILEVKLPGYSIIFLQNYPGIRVPG